MKKYGIISLLILIVLGYSHQAKAILPDYTPLQLSSPQFCASCIASDLRLVSSYIQQYNAAKEEFKRLKDVKYLKRRVLNIVSPMGMLAFNNLMGRMFSPQKMVSYSRTIADNDYMKDEKTLKEAYVKYFLHYPSKREKERNYYDEILEEFKVDSVVEIYITVREMEKDLQGMLTTLDEMQKCLAGSDECKEEYKCNNGTGQSASDAATNDGEQTGDNGENEQPTMCQKKKALQAARIYDTIMRYNEEIVSLNAQYQSVMMTGSIAKVMAETEKLSDEDIMSGSDLLNEAKKANEASGKTEKSN